MSLGRNQGTSNGNDTHQTEVRKGAEREAHPTYQAKQRVQGQMVGMDRTVWYRADRRRAQRVAPTPIGLVLSFTHLHPRKMTDDIRKSHRGRETHPEVLRGLRSELEGQYHQA